MKTLIEKKSERKKKAIMGMVQNGEMSIVFALSETERLNDEGRLLDADYEELAEYLEELLNEEPTVEEPTVEEPTAEEPTAEDSTNGLIDVQEQSIENTDEEE